MAKRYMTISDLSGEPIEDEDGAVTIAVLEHPAISRPVQLDAGANEVEDLSGRARDYVLVELVSQGGDQRERLVLDVDEFNGMLRGNAESVLSNAEPYQAGPSSQEASRTEPRRQGRQRASTGRKERTDYTQLENIGLIHRGRITDAEKELVAGNFERAQENRRREGQPEIDLRNPKDVEKYGLQDLAQQ